MRHYIIFLLLTIFTLLSYNNLHAQCPRGKTYCEGECGLFIDEDGDGCCDHVIKPVSKKSEQVSPIEDTTPKRKIIVDSLNANLELVLSGEDTVVEVLVTEVIEADHNFDFYDNDNEDEVVPTPKQVNRVKPYRLIGITSITIIAYFFTFTLVKIGKLRRLLHRKIWNAILLLTFIMSCLLGLLLVVQLNYNVFLSLYQFNLKLHVEFGIAMSLIGIIHILWHITYFKNLFRVCSKETRCQR